MTTTLIVARMQAQSADAVADVFARSDETDLPHLVGVSRRRLFRYRGLYFHLFETDGDDGGDAADRVDAVRRHPLFTTINEQLGAHIEPYDPATWRSHRDATAEQFYDWRAGDRALIPGSTP